ncbi:MAG: polyprenyl synthetase family protein [Epsilonproteobacteria bacterium]|nr:polyprenyl synthetase family protein [Campylobacterota bacterium]
MINFEKFLKSHLITNPSFHPFFQQATNEMLLAGGKRFRPMLLLSIVRQYNSLLIDSAYYAALAIEMIHTYSLIHDDLPDMDDASLRRGHPTLHTTYDTPTAILVGDGLNTYAFYLLSISPLSSDTKIDLIKELGLAAGLEGMVLGQAIDIYFEDKELQLDEVEFMHIHKTAKLIAASLKMGAIIVNLPTAIQSQLYDFGIKLGLLFQVQDDILDVTLDESEAGKDTNADGDKNSFVKLLTLPKAVEYADRLASQLQSEFEQFDTQLQLALEEIIKTYLYRHKAML